MPAVCMYFQVHQPYRVPAGSKLDNDNQYFDDKANQAIVKKVAEKCYLPTNHLLKELIIRHKGAFRVAMSISGVALEQMRQYAPEVLRSFQDLVSTGGVEVISETYYHSLAALYDIEEFKAQVAKHRSLIRSLFGVTPTVFRNTELIYNDAIGQLVADMGFVGVIAEGVDDVLNGRSPNFVYRVPQRSTALLLKNYRLSDDIAFRFSNREWSEYPLSPQRFAHWVHALEGTGDTVNLFMDYETFGEHQWASSGIFEFLEKLPEAVLANSHWKFLTPSQVATRFRGREDLSFHRTTSWADQERDTSAWCGNNMQYRALHEAFALKDAVYACGLPGLLHAWRKLLTSDHFYYMCTKWFSDGDVHAYFSPYESPYEAFIAYMGALFSLQREVQRALSNQPTRSAA